MYVQTSFYVDLVPRIVVTEEDGRRHEAAPSPKLAIRKKDSFCTSLPDVSGDADLSSRRVRFELKHISNPKNLIRSN
jgi:hypothetical protein